MVCDFLEILKPHSFCCLVAFESGLAQGLGLRTPPQKIFSLYKKGPHPIVKDPKFYKKYEFFLNCCALFIISDIRDITNFTIDLQIDILPITKSILNIH